MRVIVGRRSSERQAASTNTMSRFETEVLTQGENLQGLVHLNAQWVAKAMACTPHRRVILDMHSSASPVHGEQEGQPTTVTLAVCAIVPSSASTSSETAKGPCCVPATSIARTIGSRCWTPSWRATSGREYGGTSGPMLPSPSQASMSNSRGGASSALSGSPATKSCNGRSPLC